MDWKTGNDLKIFSCYPYRIEKVREKYKLYRYTRVPIDGAGRCASWENLSTSKMLPRQQRTTKSKGGFSDAV